MNRTVIDRGSGPTPRPAAPAATRAAGARAPRAVLPRSAAQIITALTLLATACGDGTSGAAELAVVRDTVGDTVVVRTVAGSVWESEGVLTPEMSIGELEGDPEYLFGRITSLAVGADGTLYVVDGQVPELRAYGPDGQWVATLAGPGEGPGELKAPDGGLVVLTDGRILVRDPGNARIQVFAPDGSALESWPVVRGGFRTSRPMWWDREDNVYLSILLEPGVDVRDWRTGLARIRPDGTPGDTLVPPDAGFEEPAVEARVQSGDNVSVSRNGVPFAPDEVWVLHPGGYFVHGVSDRYALTLNRPDGPLRIERDAAPIPVGRAEKEAAEWETTRNMRSMKPDWTWNGPPIPDTKPAYSGVYVARDGRIWVRVSQEGYEEEDPDYDPREEGSRPTRWREPVVFDVFEEDGTYLGRVRAPEGFSPYPTPLMDGDQVWAVTRDELGVERVVRFRVTFPG